MEYRTLGRTGMRVSPLGLGTMLFGAWGNTDRGECATMLAMALDAGINLVDCADVYADGESESILGEALAGRRDDVILATKVYGPMGGDINNRGGSRRWVIRACEDSLRRLRTDWIDLYQLHQPDHSTDIDETLGAMSDLVQAGKVRCVGTSNFQAEEIVEALWAADRRGRERVHTTQPPYSIFVRNSEAALLPSCRRHGLGVIAYSPLNGGWLTGRYRHDRPSAKTVRNAHYPEKFDPSIPHNRRKLDALDELAVIAADAGISLTHLALGFVTAHPVVSSALVGPRTPDQLAGQLGALDLRLDDEVLARIDAVVPPGSVIDLADAGYRAGPAEVAWHERRIDRVM